MSGPVDVRKDLNSIASLLEQLRQNNAAIMLDRVSAAVAELIEALQSIVASLAEHDDEGMIEHAQQMIAARAALAKATGEQP